MSEEVKAESAQETPKAEEAKVDAVDSKNEAVSQNEAEKPKEGVKADEKPTEEAGKKSEESEKVVPEKYDLKVPENSILDANVVNRIADYAKSQGLSNDEAQALLDQENVTINEHIERKTNQWAEECKSDKEIGGENFNQNVELAKRVVLRYGSDQLKAELNKTGFGNHPEVVRVFARIGKAMGEDKLVLSNTQASGKMSMEEKFYGGSQENNKE